MTEQEVRRYLRQMKEEDSGTGFFTVSTIPATTVCSSIACYFVKHEEWAQEIVLDVFMKLWEQRARLPEVNNIEDYCLSLPKRLPQLPGKENWHPTLSSEQLPELSGQADSPEDTLISEELFARYVRALDRLPERCREVFIRLREEKQSYAQVAEELNISTKTVDAQLQKALTRLRKHC